MKKELFNRLQAYDSYFVTATQGNFIRSLTTSQIEDLISIGAELGIHYKNNHCPKCALDFITQLAMPYYEHLKEKETKENERKGNISKRGGKETPDNGSDSEGGEIQQHN